MAEPQHSRKSGSEAVETNFGSYQIKSVFCIKSPEQISYITAMIQTDSHRLPIRKNESVTPVN